MKKNILFLLTLFSTSLIMSKSVKPKMHFTIALEKANVATTDFSYEENFTACMEIFKHFQTMQQQRPLSLEEMRYIFEIVIFLLDESSDDFGKRIEIQVEPNKKITLPFSKEILSLVFSTAFSESLVTEDKIIS